MLLRQESCDGVEVLCVSGPLGVREADGLVTAARRVLGQARRGVVLDLCAVPELSAEAQHRLTELAAVLPGDGRSPVVLCPQVALPEVPPALTAPDREAALARVERRAAPRTVIDVEHSLNGPAQARAAAQSCAQQLGFDETRDDVILLVSEMVTNAVRYAAPPVRLELQVPDDDVVVAVRDGSPAQPEPRSADAEAEGGRGMLLVDMLTSDHGVRIDPPGKAIWARLRRSANGS